MDTLNYIRESEVISLLHEQMDLIALQIKIISKETLI